MAKQPKCEKHGKTILQHLSENKVRGARVAIDSPDAGVLKTLFKANLFSAEQQEELLIFYFTLLKK